MTLPISQPFPQFFDLDGSPLDNGSVYFGGANDNPETAPIVAYWDAGLTLPAAQPLKTLNGYLVRNGTPATVFVGVDTYSCTVKNKSGGIVIYSPSVASASIASVQAATNAAAAAAISAGNANASAISAANSAASVLTQAQLDDYLAKMRVPIGSVIPVATSTVPYGHLECNGAPVSRTSYAELFAAIGVAWGSGDGVSTFNLPDFRGEFIRGWDHGRGVDTGRAFASAQTSQNLAHSHTLKIGINTKVPASDGYAVAAGNTVIASAFDGTTQILSSGGTEARPRNIAVMYVIKAFDAPLISTTAHDVVTEATASRTLALIDAQKYIRCTWSSGCVVTVPLNATVAFPIGTEVDLFHGGSSGSVTIDPAIGVTINATALNIGTPKQAATLKKVGTDEWDLVGALA